MYISEQVRQLANKVVVLTHTITSSAWSLIHNNHQAEPLWLRNYPISPDDAKRLGKF